MSIVHFYSDLGYEQIKNIEKKYNDSDSEYLIKKASDYICKIITSTKSSQNKFLFICGPGSNGLDGVFAANQLLSLGYDIKILYANNNNNFSYLERLRLNEYLVTSFLPNEFDCIVDCIYGYGFNRDLDEEQINLVNQINLSGAYIFSIDIPSGLSPTTGRSCPTSVKCNTLISLVTYKRGTFTNEGRDTWNEIYFSNLVDDQLISKNYLISASDTYDSFNFSKNYTNDESFSQHKKSRGVSCVISGEQPYHGAMILSVTALIKLGCQYLHVYTDKEYAHTLPMIIPEVISSSFSLPDFKLRFKKFSNILLGPGTDKITIKYLQHITDNLNCINSLVVDAGALKFLKKGYSYSNKLIITPHPGEAAELLNITSKDVQNNRYEAARLLNKMFDCIVILKGSGTIIYDGKSFFTCMDGNYRMAVAGMGDTLSGILLYELSSNTNALDACIKAVTFHSYSADHLMKASKKIKFMPSMIPEVYNELVNP
tara:strand:- start:8966 stop:10420 length:1455 start_codon:yes stop_codon:yes gene_type:complete